MPCQAQAVRPSSMHASILMPCCPARGSHGKWMEARERAQIVEEPIAARCSGRPFDLFGTRKLKAPRTVVLHTSLSLENRELGRQSVSHPALQLDYSARASLPPTRLRSTSPSPAQPYPLPGSQQTLQNSNTTLPLKSFTYPIPHTITLHNSLLSPYRPHPQPLLLPLSVYLQPSLSTVVSSSRNPGTKLSGRSQTHRQARSDTISDALAATPKFASCLRFERLLSVVTVVVLSLQERLPPSGVFLVG
ncbi:hypothetical protein VTL71DRAFT_8193 [Oculimacula yallundae]|uniref:Uncharacterized protein n=1 Tax=Oculimacula yallundae TaxID=86028 RepID=A0ABR4CWZ6_9HELO